MSMLWEGSNSRAMAVYVYVCGDRSVWRVAVFPFSSFSLLLKIALCKGDGRVFAFPFPTTIAAPMRGFQCFSLSGAHESRVESSRVAGREGVNHVLIRDVSRTNTRPGRSRSFPWGRKWEHLDLQIHS